MVEFGGFQGKSEQMIEYIRKLRTCIKWFMDLEDGHLSELEKLRGTVEFQEKGHTELGKFWFPT